MCGLVAFYCLSGKHLNARFIEDMTTAMEHRGRDDHGYCYVGQDGPKFWHAEDARPQTTAPGVALGHRRMSVFDLSVAGRQPFISGDKRHTLVFNGEVYNFIELAEELEGFGYRFETSCDTEVVLAAYQHWGPDCFRRFNGAFAIIVWDDVAKELVVARDRIGEKPVLYTQVNGDWLFASEIKVLMQHPDVHAVPNREAVVNFIGTGRSPRVGETFYSGIWSLEAGTYLKFKDGKFTQTRYWDIESLDTEAPANDADAFEQLNSLLTDAVRVRMRGDLRVGAMLSGGMDSTSVITSVVSVLSSVHNESRSIGDRLQAFTASFPGEANDETDKVNELCAMIDIAAHKAYPIEQDGVAECLAPVTRALEAPFGSSVVMTHDLLMKLIRTTDVHVVLDGLGADEMLGGFEWYVPVAVRDDLRRLRVAPALANLRGMRKHHGKNIWKEAIRSVLPPGFPSLVDTALARIKGERGSWADGMFDDPLDMTKAMPRGRTSLERNLKYDLSINNTPKWLHMGDNISMSNSVVCRSPFLDYRLIEFAFGIGNDLRVRNGVTKFALREAKRSQLPASIVDSVGKIQFLGPTGHWLRGPLKQSLLALRDPARTRLTEFVQPRSLVRAIDDFYARDTGGPVDSVWRLLHTEVWLHEFF